MVRRPVLGVIVFCLLSGIVHAGAGEEIADRVARELKEEVRKENLDAYRRFARETVDAMSGIQNWEGLGEAEVSMIVHSICQMARFVEKNRPPDATPPRPEFMHQTVEVNKEGLRQVTPKILRIDWQQRRVECAQSARSVRDIFLDLVRHRPLVVLDVELNRAAMEISDYIPDKIVGRKPILPAQRSVDEILALTTMNAVEELVDREISAMFTPLQRSIGSVYQTRWLNYRFPMARQDLKAVRGYLEANFISQGVCFVSRRELIRAITTCWRFAAGEGLPKNPRTTKSIFGDAFRNVHRLHREAPDIVPLRFGGPLPDGVLDGSAFGIRSRKERKMRKGAVPPRGEPSSRKCGTGAFAFSVGPGGELTQPPAVRRLRFFVGWFVKITGTAWPGGSRLDILLAKRLRKDVTCTVSQLQTFGGSKNPTDVEMDGLTRRALELFEEFTRLPLAEGQHEWSRKLRRQYRAHLEKPNRHAERFKALVADVRSVLTERKARALEDGWGVEVLLYERASMLFDCVQTDIELRRYRISGQELTGGQNNRLGTIVRRNLRTMRELGVFERDAGVSPEFMQGLGPVGRLMLKYFVEAKKHNPVFDEIDRYVPLHEMQKRYEDYMGGDVTAAEKRTYERLLEKLDQMAGPPEDSGGEELSVGERMTLLLRFLERDIYEEEQLEPAETVRSLQTIRDSRKEIQEAGLWGQTGAVEEGKLQSLSAHSRDLMKYFQQAANTNPILTRKPLPADRYQSIYDAHKSRRPEAERRAYRQVMQAMKEAADLDD